MNFIKKIIKKPVTVCMIVLVLLSFGIFSVINMPVKLLPDLNIPILGVTVVYPGASPSAVEEKVTKKLEDGLANITSVTDVTSYSLDNASFVVLSFEYETNLDDKKSEIKECINKLNLPEECYSPEIVEVDFNSSAIASVAITNDEDDVNKLRDLANNLEQEFYSIDGVGNVQIKGLPSTELVINPIMGLEMTSLLIVEAVGMSSLDIPLGSITTNNGIISVRNESAPQTLLDLANLMIEIPLPRSAWLSFQSYQKQLSNIKEKYSNIIDNLSANSNNLNNLFNKLNNASDEELLQIRSEVMKYKDQIDSIPNDQYNPDDIVKKYFLPLMRYGIQLNKTLVNTFRNVPKDNLQELFDYVSIIQHNGYKLSVELLRFISNLDFDQIKYDSNVNIDNASIGRYVTPLCYVTTNDNETLIIPNIVKIDVKTTHDSYSYYNNHLGVTLEVYGKSGSNTSKIVKNVKKVISQNQEQASIVLLGDQAKFIDDSISNVITSILIGGALAIIVIYLFLRKVRSSIVIAITMPLSVLTALIIMYLMGITLNMVSLGGMAVGIGMLVDNSIVVIESITKRRENDHLTVLEASFKGTKDVIGSLFASTLTTVCVFMPILFTKGLTKEIFTDLSWAVILSLCISFIVAVIIIPSLYALLYKSKNETIEQIKQDKFTQKLEIKYRNLLEKALTKKALIIVGMVIIFIASIGLVITRGIEFLPPSDQGQIEIKLEYDSKTTLDEANKMTLEIKDKIEENIKNIDYLAISVGKLGLIKTSMNGNISLKLNNKAKKTKTVVQDIRELLKDVKPSVSVKEVDGIVASITSNFNDLTISLTGDDEEKLIEITDKIEKQLLQHPGITGVQNNLTSLQTEYKVDVDINKCKLYNIDYQTLIKTLRVGLAGYNVGTINNSGDEISIKVSFMKEAITSYENLSNFIVGFTAENPLHLSDIATISMAKEKVLILKDNGKFLVQLKIDTYNLDTGNASKLITNTANEVLKDYPNYTIKASGVQAYLNDAFKGLVIALIVSVFLLYLVMACQFESLTKPLIIMTSIPLTFTGAFLALTITNVSLNIVSFIGIIMLMGVIVNNAIIMLDEIKRLTEEEHLSEYDAVLKGCSNRLRPILMTTLTTILALIPLSLGLGSGGELMQPMGIVVIGGLLLGTIVTLLLIPSIYCSIKRINKKQE